MSFARMDRLSHQEALAVRKDREHVLSHGGKTGGGEVQHDPRGADDQVPLRGESPVRTIAMQIMDAVVPPLTANPQADITSELETIILRALEKTGGNRTHAAKLLDLSHRALLYKIKDFGLA